MAIKKKSYNRSRSRKPFWETWLERVLSMFKMLLIPSLVIWLIAWLWLGGVFAHMRQAAWNEFVTWTAQHGLVVKDVVIHGRDKISLNALQQAISVSPGEPLLSVDIDAIQTRIGKMEWVDTVTIARHYNGVITLQIHERVPFVIWDRIGRKPVLVDTEGEIIHSVPLEKFSKLLIVKGVDAPSHAKELITMVSAEPDVAKHVKAAEWIGGRRWDLITSGKTRIHLPQDDIGYAISRLAKLNKEKNILSDPLFSIDLRGKDRIIIEKESP